MGMDKKDLETTTSPTAEVNILDTSSGTWSAGATLQNGRGIMGCAMLDGKIYVTGGLSLGPGGLKVQKSTSVYDPRTDSWDHSLAEMPTGRVQHKLSVAGGKLWAVGGKDDEGKFCEDMVCYSPTTDSWAQYPGLSPPRFHISTVTMGQHIWVFGGQDNGQEPTATDKVDKFNLTTAQWEVGEGMP